MSEVELGLVITNISRDHWFAILWNEPRTLGRSLDSDICIPKQYQTVSRTHAKIWCGVQGGWVCDTGSRFGTSINGVRIQAHRDTLIAEGDRLTFGSLEMSLINLRDLPSPAAPSSVSFDEEETDGPLQHLPVDVTSRLSNSEREVLLWMSRGFTSPAAIARQAGRSPNTVRTQFMSIYYKLGLKSREDLFRLLMRPNTPESGHRSGSNLRTETDDNGSGSGA